MSHEEAIVQDAEEREILHVERSDIGLRREENQDSFGVIEGSGFKFFVVADGMGGVKGGALASSLAVETVREELSKVDELTPERIQAAVQRANAEIFARGSGDPSLTGMGTTFVGVALCGERTYIVNVGDSRVYCARGEAIQCLTEDHTLVMELLRSGTIDAEQAKNHPVSHMLTRSLGPAEHVEVDCMLMDHGPYRGDVLILCSDGLYNLVGESEMLAILQRNLLEPAVEKLIELANARGGTDNITVIGIELGSGFPLPPEDEVAIEIDEQDLSRNGTSQAASDAEASEKPTQEKQEVNGAAPETEKQPPLSESAAAEKSDAGPRVEQHINFTTLGSKLGERREEGSAARSAATTKRPVTGSARTQAKAPPAAATPSVLSRFSTLFSLFGAALAGGMVAVLLSTPTQPRPVPRSDPLNSIQSEEIKRRESARQADAQRTAAQRPPATVPQVAPESADKPPVLVPWTESMGSLERRREAVADRLDQVQNMIMAFSRPLSGEIAERASHAEKERKNLIDRLDTVRSEMDVATRGLSLWYGRRKRLETTDPINLVSEVAVSSEDVRKKKEAFETATWEYLKEAEKLEFSPDDAALSQNVTELVRQRTQRMQELVVSVRSAIDGAIGDSHQKIAELTMERDRLVSEIRSLEEDLEFVRILTGSDAKAKENRRQKLIAEKDLLQSELSELSRLAEPAAPVMPPAEIPQ